MHCYTILLTCGWLLLMAHEKLDGSFELSRPLREWKQVQFFDSANECNLSVARTFAQLDSDIHMKRVKEYQQQLGGNVQEPSMYALEALRKVLAEGPTAEQKALQQRQVAVKNATRCIPTEAINFPLK